MFLNTSVLAGFLTLLWQKDCACSSLPSGGRRSGPPRPVERPKGRKDLDSDGSGWKPRAPTSSTDPVGGYTTVVGAEVLAPHLALPDTQEGSGQRTRLPT